MGLEVDQDRSLKVIEAVPSNVALCVLPVAIIPVAAKTPIMGPCAGVLGPGSGLLLLLTALVGIALVTIEP